MRIQLRMHFSFKFEIKMAARRSLRTRKRDSYLIGEILAPIKGESLVEKRKRKNSRLDLLVTQRE